MDLGGLQGNVQESNISQVNSNFDGLGREVEAKTLFANC
jgi:hypothetical protein